jgi:hypothetical protein
MSSTFSAGSADSASGSKEPGCEPLPSVRSSLTPAPSSPSTGLASPVIPTLEPLPPLGLPQTEFPWMLSAEDSPARISASPESNLALTVTEAAYGRNTPELLAKFDLGSSSWKTSQHSLFGGLTEFSETWPRSGTMRNGIAFRLPPLALATDATDFGSLPTPAARDWKDCGAPAEYRRHSPGLTAIALWPTPRRNDGEKRGNIANDVRNGLPAAVRYWPTPNAGDYQRGMSDTTKATQYSLPREVAREAGIKSGKRGGLNPTWVEWLMGFPLQWTELKDWATPSSRKSRKSSGEQS